MSYKEGVGSSAQPSGTLGTKVSQPLGRKKSEISILNVQYGNLNPIFDSGITDLPNGKTKAGYHFFQKAKSVIEKEHSSNLLANSGPYVGIVLRIESNQSSKQVDGQSWAERTQMAADTEISPHFSIRVRIPELHAHLPIPETLPKNNKSSSKTASEALDAKIGATANSDTDNQIIDMYPLFSSTNSITSNTNSNMPQVASLVWVDFIDKDAHAGGIYVKPYTDTTGIYTEKVNSKASSAFNEGASVQSSMNTSPPNGQSTSESPSEDAQVAKFQETNHPFLQKNSNNFYSSTGGFLLNTKTTLAGFSSKIVDENGRIKNKSAKILNRGIYKVPTETKYIKNLSIKPNPNQSTSDISKLRTNKVRVYSYGQLNRFSENSVVVPTVYLVENQRLHILAAERLKQMNYAWVEHLQKQNIISGYFEGANVNVEGIFKISKGAVENKYNNNYDLYVEKMIEKYGSLKQGSIFEPFHSAYETGLVFDIGNNGLQNKDANYKDIYAWNWLTSNAHLYGIYPSGDLFWKWEIQLPRESWFSGKDFADQETVGATINGKYYKYASYVLERSIQSGKLTSDKEFKNSIFK
jgi:hypothetical protein